MKKVLFTTTALVAFAGAASADIALTGEAEIGIRGGSNIDTQYHQDMDITFAMSGETDAGLAFGANVDLSDGIGGAFPAGHNGTNVWISGSFGKLTLGDTDGALDWAMQEIDIASGLGNEHRGAGYNGNNRADGIYDGQIARYENTFGDFGVALSAELDDTGVGSTNWGLGVKYNASLGGVELGLGLGYQKHNNGIGTGGDAAWGLSVDAKFSGGFRTILNYSDLGDTDGLGVDETHFGMSVGYSTGAWTVAANYGAYDEGTAEQESWGLAVNYDLGGGATVKAAYGDTTSCGVYAGCATGSLWSAGLAFEF